MTRARAGRGDPGVYAEREPPRASALDRALAEFGYAVHRALRRELPGGAALAAAVAGRAQRARGAPLEAQARELRYRLRRDGLEGEELADCLALYAAALPQGQASPGAAACAAAAALVRGRIVDIAAPTDRWHALAMAATAFALCGVPVHLLAASEARARAAAEVLRPALETLGSAAVYLDPGMSAEQRRVAYGAPVVCATQRQIGFDYLRDRVRLGRRLRPMQGRIEWLSGGTGTGVPLLLAGLHCALVEDADLVLLDDARAPMVVGADTPAGGERLPYEQALELAKALEAQADYAIGEQGAQLSAHGAERLAQLCGVLGGLWAAPKRREELVALALTALHAMERGRDYQVQQGALRLAPGDGGEELAPSEALQRLLEVKEGLAFGGRREVLARLSVPRFFGRYLRLAGVCADARGVEREFWSLYALRAARAGEPLVRRACMPRVYLATEKKRRALVAAVREHAGRGEAVVVSLRTPEEAEAVAEALGEAGVPFTVAQTAAAAPRREAPAAAAQAGRKPDAAALAGPGSVVLSLHPAQRDAGTPMGGVPVHLAVAELHEAARHVEQIARAWGASSCEQFLALEDEVVAKLTGGPARVARGGADRQGLLPAALARRVAARAQAAAEGAAARARREAMARDRALEDLLAFSGAPE